jgi:hypothetical protein
MPATPKTDAHEGAVGLPAAPLREADVMAAGIGAILTYAIGGDQPDVDHRGDPALGQRARA